MKEIKSSGDYKIFEKKSGRDAVKDGNKKYVNGDDKAKILADAGLVTISVAKPKEPEPAEETATEAPVAAEEAATEE